MNQRKILVVVAVALNSMWLAPAQAGTEYLREDVTISKEVLGSTLSVRSAHQFAGAIDSLMWQGVEFINRYDHGRQLQSAASFDGFGECFNPTEAGTSADGTKVTSSSVLLDRVASGNYLQTTSQMSFWLAPNFKYPQNCGSTTLRVSQNKTVLSTHKLTKKISIGYNDLPNVLDYQVTFHVPESYKSATFEALTGYMTTRFTKFYAYDAKKAALESLSDGPGEQSKPVVFSSADEKYAMGVISPQAAGYGRWRFKNPSSSTNKWNCVFRAKDLKAGDYTYKCLVVVGDLKQVTATMKTLSERLKKDADMSTPKKGSSAFAPVISTPVGKEFTGTAYYVNYLYKVFLNRVSDPVGLDFNIGVIRNYGCAAAVRTFAYAPEYTSVYRSNSSFVTSVYSGTLLRAPDAPGRQFWVDMLAQGHLNRDQVIEMFISSAEFAQTCAKYRFAN
ncbi:MAG: DUF4214 domain-containing protein [Bdellovibrionaceae bacterium]|nr:DUF4214 domain-containing protein [Pseudobdellovibrionaceae bacterium]